MVDFLANPLKYFSEAEAKSLGINDLPPEAWKIIRGGQTEGQAAKLFRHVPWLFRGVHMRAQAVSKMPFFITSLDGSTELDNSRDYKNAVGFLPDLVRLLYLYESSLTMEGAAYLALNKGARSKKVKEVQYLHPLSIVPKIEQGKVVYFERRTADNASPITLSLAEVVHTFLPDPYKEAGPGASPGKAALAASGVLDNVDTFVASYFLRGAVKATILTVESGEYSSEEDLERTRSWWQRVVTGVKDAWGAHIASSRVKPLIVGEGLESLSNNNLTTEKREDIATALGIPQSLLFSNTSTYATADQDDAHFYDKTVVPECELIESDLNEQLFAPLGFRFRFDPDGLDVFQEDEARRSGAYKNYTDAGMRPSIAAQILGIELPQGIEYIDLDSDLEAKNRREEMLAEANAARFLPGGGGAQNGEGEDDQDQDDQDQERKRPGEQAGRGDQNSRAIVEELDRWQRKTLKAVKAGKAVPEFESDIIPALLMGIIGDQLETVGGDPEKVRAVFAGALDWREYP